MIRSSRWLQERQEDVALSPRRGGAKSTSVGYHSLTLRTFQRLRNGRLHDIYGVRNERDVSPRICLALAGKVPIIGHSEDLQQLPVRYRKDVYSDIMCIPTAEICGYHPTFLLGVDLASVTLLAILCNPLSHHLEAFVPPFSIRPLCTQ